MANKKISQLASAEATVAAIFPVVVSGANQQLGLRDMIASLGIPQYVEATCRATTAIVTLPRCNIFDIYTRSLVGSSAADGGSDVYVGKDTQISHYAVISTSGGGGSGTILIHASARAFSNGARLVGASGDVVAAAPTASANASFVVGIGYFRV